MDATDPDTAPYIEMHNELVRRNARVQRNRKQSRATDRSHAVAGLRTTTENTGMRYYWFVAGVPGGLTHTA